jgi:hypothetical protein
VIGNSDTESSSALLTLRVTNARAISGKTLFALVDIEMKIACGCFAILRCAGPQRSQRLSADASAALHGHGWHLALVAPAPYRITRAIVWCGAKFLVDEELARGKYDAAATVGRGRLRLTCTTISSSAGTKPASGTRRTVFGVMTARDLSRSQRVRRSQTVDYKSHRGRRYSKQDQLGQA